MKQIITEIPIAYKDGKYSVATPGVSIRNLGVQKKYQPTPFSRTEATNPRKWAEYGDYDNLPQIIHSRLSSVPMAIRAIYEMSRDLYGNGLIYVKRKDFFEGRIIGAYDPRVDAFFTENRVQQIWLPNQAFARTLFWNAFSKMDLSKDKSKIVRLDHLDTMWSRLSKQNPSSFEIEYLYYCGKFGGDDVPSEADLSTIPLLRQYKPDFFNWLKGDSFAFHTKGFNAGTTYYSRPLWMEILKQGSWLDVARDVPRIVKSLQENQAHIKYVMRVSQDYFKFRYPDWFSYSAKEQTRLIEEFEAGIEEGLTGAENPGKLMTMYLKEEHGKFIGTIELVPLDDKFKSDYWVPSSATANAEILNALGYHSSQMSMMNEGGKMGAGSGSDARVHFNSGVLRNTIEQMEILEPLQYIFNFNKWDYVVLINNFAQTTTDNQSSGVANTPKTQKPH
jgi:hypothetical protein